MQVWELYLRSAKVCGCCCVCACCPCEEAAAGPEGCCSKAFWSTKPRKCQFPLFSPPKSTATAPAAAPAAEGGGEAAARPRSGSIDQQHMSWMERFFHSRYSPALTKHLGSNKLAK